MTIYMPPLCRKKKVLDRYDPNSFRVISQYAEDTHSTFGFQHKNEPSEWRKKWLENEGLALPDIYTRKTEVLPHSAPDYRIHRPHPGSCGFLRNNVRLLNEPICSVYTASTADEQHSWWPSRTSNEPLREPPRTNDTIYRGDFAEKEKSGVSFGSLRHTANPNKEPALGTVPVNFLKARDGKQRLFKEKISYEHQYNSRKDPNYPVRAKRHGSFVWDQMSQEKTNKFIQHYSVITPEEGLMRQEQLEADKLATAAAKMLEETAMKDTIQNAEATEIASPKASPKGSPKQSGQVSPKQLSPEEKKGAAKDKAEANVEDKQTKS